MHKILRYHQLNTKGVQKQVKKVEQHLIKGDFAAADVKKMRGTDGLYRAKLDKSDRLLFKFARYQDETYILLLEVIRAHNYDRSKFLRGADIQETQYVSQDSPPSEDVQDMVYINPKRPQFHLLDKVISFDESQREIYDLPVPLIIIGSAGSGKTALTLEKMKDFHGQVAYLSLSPYLVENAQRIYYAHGYENERQEVDFMSFEEYLQSIRIPKGREVSFRDFDGFYARYRQTYKFKEPYKLYEEFKGVLTGSITDKAYMSREDYLGLGIRQSIFLKAEREKVYELFERYLAFMEESNLYDPNMVAYEYLPLVEPLYDFVVVDEVQDITNIQLMLILKSLIDPTHFLLSGDSNQIVHPNFFSWSKIKSLFFTQEVKGSLIRILKTNYRNSQQITRISNDLLKIKNARFGSIDKESTYLIDTVSTHAGEVNFFPDQDKIKKDLNNKTRNSAKYAVLVMDKTEKARVRQYFNTPLIFTIQEAKGLEYENIILLNFISGFDAEFREIGKGVTQADLSDENLRFSRAKEKENKDLEAYKFYINSLYVAFTRAVKNLFLIESNQKHDLLKLLGVVKSQAKVAIKKEESSTDEEWLEEAKRLEKQGKLEQAQEIRDRLRGIAYLSLDAVETLKEEIFGAEQTDSNKCKELFTYAKNRYQIPLIRRLYQEAKYGPAKQFMDEYWQAGPTYTKHIRNNNLNKAKRLIAKYGINMRDKEGMTGLMLAVLYNRQALIDYFLANEAAIYLPDHKNRTVLHMALLSFERETIDEKRLASLYTQFKPASVRVKTGDRIVKLSSKSMEYFLLHYLIAVREEVIATKNYFEAKGLNMDDFEHFISWMPPAILAPYRLKRQYINSILAKNEIDKEDKYNRQLFKRKARGVYDLRDGLELMYGEG